MAELSSVTLVDQGIVNGVQRFDVVDNATGEVIGFNETVVGEPQ